MNSNVIPLLQVPVLLVFLTLLEVLIPLREQSRVAAGRLLANLTLNGTTILLNVLLTGVLITGAAYMHSNGFGLLSMLGAGTVVSFVVSIVALDLSSYLAHVCLHQTSWGWRIHLVHHIDRSVDATTSLRQHPLEYLWRFGFWCAAAWLVGAPPAAVALYKLLTGINAIVEHSNIRLPKWLDRALVLFWVTPDMHKVHHSREQCETDTNYGGLLSFYDRVFGTFTPSSVGRSVSYGIDGYDAPQHQSLAGLLRLPFRTHVASGTGRTKPAELPAEPLSVATTGPISR